MFQALWCRAIASDVKRAILTRVRRSVPDLVERMRSRRRLRSRRCATRTGSMGPKVTIDSSNAHEQGSGDHRGSSPVLVEDPTRSTCSFIRNRWCTGLVEFRDGSVVGAARIPDMRIPIAHCLAWPRRIDGPAARLDLAAPAASSTFRGARPSASGAELGPARNGNGWGCAHRALMRPDEVAGQRVHSRVKSLLPAIAALVEATLETLRDEVCWRNPTESMRRWPLTIWQEVSLGAPLCPKLP